MDPPSPRAYLKMGILPCWYLRRGIQGMRLLRESVRFSPSFFLFFLEVCFSARLDSPGGTHYNSLGRRTITLIKLECWEWYVQPLLLPSVRSFARSKHVDRSWEAHQTSTECTSFVQAQSKSTHGASSLVTYLAWYVSPFLLFGFRPYIIAIITDISFTLAWSQ